MAQSSTNKRPRPQRGAKHERLVNPGCQKFKLQHGIATTTNISY